MPDYVHFTVHPRRVEYEIGEILQGIKEPVGGRSVEQIRLHSPEWLPTITRKRGNRVKRVLEVRGGFDRNVTEPKSLMAMIDYIHLDPVRGG